MLRRDTSFESLFDVFKDFDDLRRAFLTEWGQVPTLLPAQRRMLPGVPMKSQFLPAVEAFTKDKNLVLRAELPGIDPKDVELTIVGDQLILKGEKKEEQKVEEKDLYFREICRGRFERMFTLPEGVRADQIKAQFVNGVLEVILPAETIQAQKKIPIEAPEGGKKSIKAA